MPRPDLTEERSAEILDAFERCVARFGLEGSTLEQVAEEAGVKRSLIRHYIGNRDDLESALVKRVTTNYRRQLKEMVAHLKEEPKVEALIESLLPASPRESVHDVLVFEALIAASGKQPRIRAAVAKSVELTVQTVASELKRLFPRATVRSSWTVAYGVVSIYFNHVSLTPLGFPQSHWQAARSSVRRLIETLGDVT